MLIVGLTGRIGAGKSTVARAFGDLGARVIEADALAHGVLDEPAVRDAVVARFGAGVLGPDGRVNRGALAARVFGVGPEHAAALEALESIVHPRVRALVDAEIAALEAAERWGGSGQGSAEGRVVVLDVPLLVQAGWDAACDRIVVVECAEDVRRARLAARGWSPAQQSARDAAWERGARLPGNHARIVRVDASGDLAYTRAQVERIWAAWHGKPSTS